jgi:hypothetical protein
MSYEANLTDSTKVSTYLITIDPTIDFELSEIVNAGTANAYIEFPYGKPLLGRKTFRTTTLRSNINELINPNTKPGINDTMPPSAVIPFTYDPALKRVYFDDSGSSFIPAFKYRVFLSTDINRTYEDPLDDSTDVIEWSTVISDPPTISRDVSDILVGFYPTVVQGFSISSTTPEFYSSPYNSNYRNADVSIYHFVGDEKDTTNGRKIFTGKISSHATSLTDIAFQVSDPSISFDGLITYPDNNQDFSDYDGSGTYRVDPAEQRYNQRTIYGVVSCVRALNVDRPADYAAPLTSENRSWVFGKYNGDNGLISSVDFGSQTYERFNYATSGALNSRLELYRTYFNTATDSEILSRARDFSIAPTDRIKLTISAYPGEVFYFEPRIVRYGFFLDVLNDAPGNIFIPSDSPNEDKMSAFYCRMFIDSMDTIIAAQVGDTAANVRANLNDYTVTKTVKRLPVSRCFLQDKNGVVHKLDPELHYNTFTDPVEKFYGVELTNVEALLPLSYSPMDGTEIVFGRVYGPGVDDLDVTGSSEGVFLTNATGINNSVFTNSNSNSSFPTVIYDYLTKYAQIDSSDIDLATFQEYAGYVSPKIVGDTYQAGGDGQTRRNIIFPKTIDGQMPDKKSQLIDILFYDPIFVYVNNEAKWTYKYLRFLTGETPVKTLYDNDFEITNREDFTTEDVYGLYKVSDNFAEKSIDDTYDGSYSISYILSSNGYILNTDQRQYDIIASDSVAVVNEENINNFNTGEGSTYTTGLWAETYADILGLRQNYIEIQVSREHFDIDIADVVTLVSSFISGSGGDETTRKYLVVGIQQFIDFRIIRLSDILNVLDRSQTPTSLTLPNYISNFVCRLP